MLWSIQNLYGRETLSYHQKMEGYCSPVLFFDGKEHTTPARFTKTDQRYAGIINRALPKFVRNSKSHEPLDPRILFATKLGEEIL